MLGSTGANLVSGFTGFTGAVPVFGGRLVIGVYVAGPGVWVHRGWPGGGVALDPGFMGAGLEARTMEATLAVGQACSL